MGKKIFLLFCLSLIIFTLLTCGDDSGVNPYSIRKGRVILWGVQNLPTLDKNVDGMYAAWLQNDSLPSPACLGYFNFVNGSMVDSNGQPAVIQYTGDTNILFYTRHCYITVQPPGANFEYRSTAILLDVVPAQTQDSLTGTLTIGGPMALGSVGQVIKSTSLQHYEIMTQTDSTFPSCYRGPSSECYSGLWFCDTCGNSLIPALTALPNNGWMYEGWIQNRNNPTRETYSLGKFSDGNVHLTGYWDLCRGPLKPRYDKIGQDWISSGCLNSLPSCFPQDPITQNSLTNGYWSVFITIEPGNEGPGNCNYYKPFPFIIFQQQNITTGIVCRGRGMLGLDNLFNSPNTSAEAHINIKY